MTLTVPQLERQGSVGMVGESRSRGEDDIREEKEEEEEEEGIYAGRDLVLAQTSRALQTIVSAERSRRRRERRAKGGGGRCVFEKSFMLEKSSKMENFQLCIVITD